MILALAGGVGGAKLADGLAAELAPADLTIVVNTGDDFRHLGLAVSPDLDTVMYTLAGVANPATGWGRAGETWSFMAALEQVGGPGWFRLGDRDLAVHVERSRRIAEGESLSAVTRALCAALGVRHAIVPMSDDPVSTRLHTQSGTLEFQEYFVREQCRPVVRALEYAGSATAQPSAAFRRALESGLLEGVVICPSNPLLSVDPILALPGVRAALAAAPQVVAVSPLIAGQALKGPAAKLMAELGEEPTSLGVARHYQGLAGTLVIDHADAPLAREIEKLGIEAVVSGTVMHHPEDRRRLAAECVALCRRCPARLARHAG